jgi:hypothetical protein
MKNLNKINGKSIRPVGFEPTLACKIPNKINTKKPVRSRLEVLTDRLLLNFYPKVKESL